MEGEPAPYTTRSNAFEPTADTYTLSRSSTPYFQRGKPSTATSPARVPAAAEQWKQLTCNRSSAMTLGGVNCGSVYLNTGSTWAFKETLEEP